MAGNVRRILEKQQQVPPLRYAPVGMTILFRYQHPNLKQMFRTDIPIPNRVVIPTGAYPDFLPRSIGQDRVCAFL
jgi:hypothetical protein